jgi:hypothetical protein
MPVCAQDHVAAAAAVTAIRSTFRHKFFSPKTHAPPSTFPCLDKDFDPINKHDALKLASALTCVIPSEAGSPQSGCGFLLSLRGGSTELRFERLIRIK